MISPTDEMLKITVNKEQTVFKQCTEFNWKMKSLQCKIRRRRKKKKKGEIFVKGCEDLS